MICFIEVHFKVGLTTLFQWEKGCHVTSQYTGKTINAMVLMVLTTLTIFAVKSSGTSTLMI